MAAYDIEKDIGPRVQIIQEIHELILAGEMEVAKGMLRTLIKVTFAYPAIFDEVRQECQINNAHVVAGCGSGYQSVYSRCQSCRTTAGKGSNLWARSFLTYTNPAALTCLLNVLVNLT
ncbi:MULTISPECIES: hypothetical protein [Salmonella]|uniref:hypothetical protein n=1 Tax=Salmonella TaxID=590 RepID=UPI000722D112|nr:hypothetical protein [Salmonella enterica]ALP98048.1 hypothetical protein FORC20_2271 [Salmonella enterica subsp. enterica serovar Typhimurium]MDJ5044386.1 hypothetical protein [Salmonella enterica]MDJ6284606.1 hypothetical protein [Salmonella enterica]MDK0458437.1 hypothetical protein [Salmonella enterica]MDK8885104.1 hypothetical protein [Salmonella enterica subsp. enterica serovar Newport]